MMAKHKDHSVAAALRVRSRPRTDFSPGRRASMVVPSSSARKSPLVGLRVDLGYSADELSLWVPDIMEFDRGDGFIWGDLSPLPGEGRILELFAAFGPVRAEWSSEALAELGQLVAGLCSPRPRSILVEFDDSVDFVVVGDVVALLDSV